MRTRTCQSTWHITHSTAKSMDHLVLDVGICPMCEKEGSDLLMVAVTSDPQCCSAILLTRDRHTITHVGTHSTTTNHVDQPHRSGGLTLSWMLGSAPCLARRAATSADLCSHAIHNAVLPSCAHETQVSTHNTRTCRRKWRKGIAVREEENVQGVLKCEWRMCREQRWVGGRCTDRSGSLTLSLASITAPLSKRGSIKAKRKNCTAL